MLGVVACGGEALTKDGEAFPVAQIGGEKEGGGGAWLPSSNVIAEMRFDGEVEGLPDISHLRDKRGNPVTRRLSCHCCTQGNASWRGNFFQPLGCKDCPDLWCPRCLGRR